MCKSTKIADFGLATQLARPDEKHMTMCGTPNFISPEVASRGSHGLEADLWGLGCLLYTLLVGSPPFDTHAVKSTLTRVVMANYQLPSHLSIEAKDLINALLQKNPRDRLKLDQILDHPFLKIHTTFRDISSRSHDSGIHTMSSRKDSAYSDGALQKYQLPLNSYPRYSSSDCIHSVKMCSGQNFNVTSLQSKQFSDHCVARNQNGSNPNLYSLSNSNCFPQKESGHCYVSEIGNSRVTSVCCCSLISVHHHPQQCNQNANRCPQENFQCPEKSKETVSDNTNVSVGRKRASCPFTPISSYRLLPTRHQTKNAILTISDNGEVCIEFIKKRGVMKTDVVCEVCRISPDGLRIVLYEPGDGKGVPPSTKPPPLPLHGSDQIYSIENLPEKHWKKYSYAAKFVELVKAKTPKVTYYTDKAKCLLMESLVDFEACFYEGGKVTQSSTEGTVIMDGKGECLTLKDTKDCLDLSGGMDLLWNHANQAKEHCILLEKTLSKLSGNNFPIIVGRRPNSSPSIGKENSIQQKMPSFAASVTNVQSSSKKDSSLSSRGSDKDRQVSIPGIGTATQLSNGEVRVRFTDGSQLWVDGKHHIRYQYPDGRMSNYRDSDSIPRHIMEKMQHMPKILKHLMPPVLHKMRTMR
ncbi:serine/threonine-protein kinase PLK4 isoform X2 [Agrilus planipennis]|uniref:Serine/threonine-protein kinase SAK n=1 Tax=Agrilus planipennis TaxID=224129 RepID=A0A1W4WFV4_AGRPL|nr:serine/threonine-protein kinase PLK4 isoform X2 [Agrilus planipennis]